MKKLVFKDGAKAFFTKDELLQEKIDELDELIAKLKGSLKLERWRNVGKDIVSLISRLVSLIAI